MSDGAPSPDRPRSAAGPTTGDDAVGGAEALPDVPDWDDEYLDRVSDCLMFNFDLERDRAVRGERFDLYGRLRIESEKRFFHRSLNYANHRTEEYLFARRVDVATVAEFERLVELGHELAGEWIDADEEHYGTEFTFVLVAPEIDEAVREFVDGFRDRTLLKFGYFGSYEVNLVAVAPDREECVASRNADVARAFELWTDPGDPSARPGLLGRLLERLR